MRHKGRSRAPKEGVVEWAWLEGAIKSIITGVARQCHQYINYISRKWTA